MSVKYGGNQRCMICDKVNSEEINHDYGEVFHGGFYLLKDKVTLVCAECMTDINQLRFEYQLDDEERERSEYEGDDLGAHLVNHRNWNFHLKEV